MSSTEQAKEEAEFRHGLKMMTERERSKPESHIISDPNPVTSSYLQENYLENSRRVQGMQHQNLAYPKILRRVKMMTVVMTGLQVASI